MKHFFKLTCAAAVLMTGTISLSILNKAKKLSTKGDGYSVQLIFNSTETGRGVNDWTLVHNDPDPGNGDIKKSQDVSH